MAYMFMTGIPTIYGGGFSMMDPDVLKRQRLSNVRLWMKLLDRDNTAVAKAWKK